MGSKVVDSVFEQIADYAVATKITDENSLNNARLALMDSLGCGFLSLRYPECTKLLGPVVPETIVPGGVRVPGTQFVLDPVQGAFNISAMIRWLDFSDTWLAAEWGHPSDNIGGILAAADYISQQKGANITMNEVLEAIVKAYEIQGVLALDNSLNRIGLDHVLFVKVASAAILTEMFGGTKKEVINAVSNAWIDSSSLRVYRHAPNAGSRKSWAAADAVSRAMQFALMARKGEMGYKTALTVDNWGFQDVLFNGKQITLSQNLDTYVMDHILFKISYPAEFHAQTALESALKLHDEVSGRINEINKVVITTHESAKRIIDKTGPLHNPADRDHCIQYITAVGLIFGDLTADHYEDDVASDSRIDALREKMVVVEDDQYSRDYLDPEKRSIANAVQVYFKDGTQTCKVVVEYPIGHHRRRDEGMPFLLKKFEDNVRTRFPQGQADDIHDVLQNHERLKDMGVREFMRKLVI